MGTYPTEGIEDVYFVFSTEAATALQLHIRLTQKFIWYLFFIKASDVVLTIFYIWF